MEDIRLSEDTLVRSCTVGYTIPNTKDRISQYTGGRRISVTRSIQRLTLLLPVEEQRHPLDIVNGEIRILQENKGQNDKNDKMNKREESCKDKKFEMPCKDKNKDKSCESKIVSHVVKSSCIDLKEDMVAEDCHNLKQDLVAEERTFFAECKSRSRSLES